MKEEMVDSQGSHWAPPKVQNGQGEWEGGQGHGISQTPPSERTPYNERNTNNKRDKISHNSFRRSDLKNVTKTCDVENARRTRAIKVVRPPLRTAGPAHNIFEKRVSPYIVSSIKSDQHLNKPILATALLALAAGDPEDAR